MPSMPSVLEINNEDTSSNQIDHNKYDESKLRSSSVRSVDQTTAHVLSTMNSSMNSNNNSSFVFANTMKPMSSDDLKKSHQQMYQHTANQMHQQITQQHPVLISTSPPNLINHMNNLDNVRRVQNQYQLSNMQRISSPSNLIYNSQTQQIAPPNAQTGLNGPLPNQNAANVNIYQQFANQMKNMHQTNTMMPPHQQFAANPFATTHILQRNQMGQPVNQNMNFVTQVTPQLTAQQIQNQQMTAAGQPINQNLNDFHARLHQAPPNLAASHLMKQHVVQAPNAFVQTAPPSMHSNPLAGQPGQGPPNAFYQNQNAQPKPPQATAYYGPPPTSHQQIQAQQHLAHQQMQAAAAAPQQQFNYIQSQQFGLITPQNSQLANAQNYRNQKRFI